MKIKIEKNKPITLFIRVKGPKKSHEYKAVIDSGSLYSIIPLQDARDMGYEAYNHPDDPGFGVKVVNKSHVEEYNEIIIQEVILGELKITNMRAIACDLPKLSHLEATLGLSFLENFKTTIDYGKGYLTIEPR